MRGSSWNPYGCSTLLPALRHSIHGGRFIILIQRHLEDSLFFGRPSLNSSTMTYAIKHIRQLLRQNHGQIIQCTTHMQHKKRTIEGYCTYNSCVVSTDISRPSHKWPGGPIYPVCRLRRMGRWDELIMLSSHYFFPLSDEHVARTKERSSSSSFFCRSSTTR
ncbi:hypothetical protein HJC23_004773 [Cyclotella cryptica]|uniref:Uncharacterized protein n=1 Tax=Cyclotella cryptica TaxID=29204 RepID=A0ABD3PGK7_9STRA